MTLRYYQQDAVNAVYDYLRNKSGNPCVVLPTGAGKTHVIAQICDDAVNQWKGRVLILAHVKELLQQASNKISEHYSTVKFGVYSAGLGKREKVGDVIIAGIQSVYEKACEFDAFDLILIDECHLLPDDGEGMYRKFLADMLVVNPAVRLIGLTATPYRLKSGYICGPDNLLTEICYEVGVRELINKGFLCRLISKGTRDKTDFSELHTRMGEFVESEVEELMNDDNKVESAVSEIIEQTKDRKSVLIFASSVEHGKHLSKLLKDRGCKVDEVYGDSTDRDEVIEGFKSGEIKYLVNMGVLTVGFDHPSVDCVCLVRPTKSPGLFYQMCGRGLRLSPLKTDCLVLDFGGNVLRHGPIDAIVVADKSGGKGNGQPPVKECPECLALIHAAIGICPECGYEFPKPELKHTHVAAREGILSDQVTKENVEIYTCEYYIHYKNHDETAPPTLRCEYFTTKFKKHCEWVCLEHSGYAGEKAKKWWTERSDCPVPKTVKEAVEKSQYLAPVVSIELKMTPGEKWPKIVACLLGKKPPYDPDDFFEYKSKIYVNDDLDDILPF